MDAVEFVFPAAPYVQDAPEVFRVVPELEAGRPDKIDRILGKAFPEQAAKWHATNQAVVAGFLKRYPNADIPEQMGLERYQAYEKHWDAVVQAASSHLPENQRIREENQQRREKAMEEWKHECAKVAEANRRSRSVCATLLAFALSLGFHTDASSRAPTWMLVRPAAAAELTDEQQHQLRKAIGTAPEYSHIKHCSCA